MTYLLDEAHLLLGREANVPVAVVDDLLWIECTAPGVGLGVGVGVRKRWGEAGGGVRGVCVGGGRARDVLDRRYFS